MAVHNFGNGSFTRELWVAGKRVFKKPTQVNVEFTTNGAIDWLIADASVAIVATKRYNGGGWHSINLPSLGLYDDYSIGFRNTSGGTQIIRGGDITYADS